MKKILILLSIVLAVMAGGNAFASEDIKIFIDGQQKFFNPGPIIQNDSTLVPMRALFETLGASVYWYEETETVVAIKDQTTVELTIGNVEAYVNNNKIYLSVRPQIIEDRTYVPLRFISEALGADVLWNGDTETITIKYLTKEKQTEPVLVDSQKYELQTIYSFLNEGDQVNSLFTTIIGAYSNSAYQQDSEITVTPNPYEIFTDDFGNKYAKIKIDNIAHGDVINIVTTKKLTNSGVHYLINQDNISSDYSELDGYDVYISPQPEVESDNLLIINKAQEICRGETDPYNIAKKAYEFVNLYMKYDVSGDYARKGALSALVTGRGVCEDYSKLFVALLRAERVPARSAFGFWLNDDTKAKIGYDNWYDVESSAHEWPEFYIPNYGWIITEPTFEYTYNGERKVLWDQFANQDSNGHIILGYSPNMEEAIKWSVSGYGDLELKLQKTILRIRKVK